VTDTGVGIPAEDRERIFESFEQGGRGVHHEGTGLGLNLSKRIVELLGGRMWLDSEVGTGSTFGFTVPVGAPATVADRPQPAWTDSGPLVVVIEDDRRSLELLTLYLEGAGVRVAVAGDGPDGLDAVRCHHPCAVVLDIRLPGMDGWEVLAALKADPQTASTPVIVVSILDEPGRGLAVGAAEYLVKPVSRDDILAALTRVGVLPEASRTLLTIDDDPLAVELVRGVLQPEGWTVLAATDGQAGVAMARSRRPSAVLLDLLMPGTDGFAVLEALRADPATMGIPIIVLTAKTLTGEDKERLRGRIWDVAQKGDFKPAVLVDLVHRAAAHATLAAEAP
jgi:CheY-like chemotaxis protein